MTNTNSSNNPFRPTPGDHPPLFVGREREIATWRRLLCQSGAAENALITGLFGVGKTCLLREFQQIAKSSQWLWAASDLSQHPLLTESDIARRVLSDVAQAMSVFEEQPEGSYSEILSSEYDRLPGLPSDKLKRVIGTLCQSLVEADFKGIVLAYDEAHNLTDRASENEFPLSMLLETVNSLQKDAGSPPVLLVLSGLPHIFDAMISTRTYSERMFHVMPLNRLSREETELALQKPGERIWQKITGAEAAIEKAVDLSFGYPCFVQYFGSELFNAAARRERLRAGDFPSKHTIHNLDGAHFGTRWAKLSKRERGFLTAIAECTGHNKDEFSLRDIFSQEWTSCEEEDMKALLEELRRKNFLYQSGPGYYAFAAPLTRQMISCRTQNRSALGLGRWLPWASDMVIRGSSTP